MEQTMKSLRYFSMLLPLFTATAVHAAAAIQSEPIQAIPKAVIKNPAMVEFYQQKRIHQKLQQFDLWKPAQLSSLLLFIPHFIHRKN